MAAKNSIKIYAEDGIYHLYNRGVDRREIFLDDQDFSVFLSYLKTYLVPKDESSLRNTISSPESSRKDKASALNQIFLKNYSGEINLLAYALLPNHFHLLLEQKNADGIDRFMNSLGVRYARYFNRRYNRVGPIFQGVYKAVLVQSDEQLLHLSRYIHLNPLTKLGLPISSWKEITWPTSLSEYYNLKKTQWVKPERVINYFNQTDPKNNYANFMGDHIDPELFAPLAIDYDDE